MLLNSISIAASSRLPIDWLSARQERGRTTVALYLRLALACRALAAWCRHNADV